MANSADQQAVSANDMALAIHDKSTEVISTLYESIPAFALMGIHMHKKPEEVLGVGDPAAPTKGAVYTGLKLDPIKLRELDQVSSYSPLVQTVRQNDGKRKSYRDTGAVASAWTGSAATITLTTTNGVVTGTTISGGGTGYSGAPPTLIVVDATGSTGFGAKLVATISGGAITVVTILNGGRGYASSGLTVIVQAGASAGQKYQRPIFKWAGYESLGTIYDNDVDSVKVLNQAGSAINDGEAIMSLVSDEITIQITEQCEQLADDFWYGFPTVGNTDQTIMYDQPFGLINAVDDSNVYGGVDRSLAANFWWRSKVDASSHPGWGLKDIVEDAHQTKGLAYKNGGLDLILAPPSMISRFKSEQISYNQRVQIEDDLRELGKYGFKGDVACYGQTYAVGDSRCPEGTVIGLNMKAVMIAFKKGKKFTPSGLTKQNGIRVAGNAGIDGSTFTINTQWMPMIIAPELCVKYTGIS